MNVKLQSKFKAWEIVRFVLRDPSLERDNSDFFFVISRNLPPSFHACFGDCNTIQKFGISTREFPLAYVQKMSEFHASEVFETFSTTFGLLDGQVPLVWYHYCGVAVRDQGAGGTGFRGICSAIWSDWFFGY